MPKTLKKPLIIPKFRFVDAHELSFHLGLSGKEITDERNTLGSPIYWYQRVFGGKFYYNLALWQHWLLSAKHGTATDRKAHDRLVEEYIQSIPKPD